MSREKQNFETILYVYFTTNIKIVKIDKNEFEQIVNGVLKSQHNLMYLLMIY